MKILEDLVVIDISTVLAGPSVATFFAELGAKVIKIEHPKNGDVTRSWKLGIEKEDSISSYYSSVNYLKENIKLDLSIEENKNQFFELIKNADILISNFKKGDALKFGIEDLTLRNLNKKLIHGKITGFGETSDRVAYDLILQAETGFMSMNGTLDSGPVKMPVALIDVLAAHQLKEGILLSLYQRNSSNKGSVIEVSLYRAALASLANQASNFLMCDVVPKRQGSLHPNIAPYGEIFKTKDNFLITFAIGSNLQFQRLCCILDVENLITNTLFANNQDRIKNRIQLQELLQIKIYDIPANKILSACEVHFVPAAKIKNIDEVLKDDLAQTMIREELIENTQTKRITSIAFRYDGN